MAKMQFDTIKRHDKMKKKYCEENNLILFEIRYDENLEEKLAELLKNIKK